ncbi:MAG: hypothetical protein ACRDPK_03545 [Carbonactinosporaceae bacterium]
MSELSDHLDRAREHVAKAQHLIPPITPAVAESAAQLLDAVWIAGLRYDVGPEDWDKVTELAGVCCRRQVRERSSALDL